jgi:hypothetical protein
MALFEKKSLAPIAIRTSGKTLHEQPPEASFAGLTHSQKLEFRQLQDVFNIDMPNAIKVLTLVKELPFKEAYNSLAKYQPPVSQPGRTKLGQT